jgi:hypothetical protein
MTANVASRTGVSQAAGDKSTGLPLLAKVVAFGHYLSNGGAAGSE